MIYAYPIEPSVLDVLTFGTCMTSRFMHVWREFAGVGSAR